MGAVQIAKDLSNAMWSQWLFFTSYDLWSASSCLLVVWRGGWRAIKKGGGGSLTSRSFRRWWWCHWRSPVGSFRLIVGSLACDWLFRLSECFVCCPRWSPYKGFCLRSWMPPPLLYNVWLHSVCVFILPVYWTVESKQSCNFAITSAVHLFTVVTDMIVLSVCRNAVNKTAVRRSETCTSDLFAQFI